MLRFSANLGFLWAEMELTNAILAAASAGFDAVECHWPFDVPPARMIETLHDAGLPMLGLNTRRGNVEAGDFGLAAVVGRESEVRGFIDEAVGYAASINATAVHVMAGRTDRGAASEVCYRKNLAYAAELAAPHGITILIEPINQRDVAGYHLSYVEDAVATIEALQSDNVKMMFDCYHVQIMQGDLIHRLCKHLDYIGHVQIAAVPDRGEPNAGELDYRGILMALEAAGYEGFIGAEYRPRTTTIDGLGWLEAAKSWQA